jgi:CBS domain-containing protein
MPAAVFHRSRLVVLRRTATLVEAVHALIDNHVGAVLVVDGHDLVGVVTDRDIALHAAAGDAATTELGALVSGIVVTCPVDASVADVLCAMRQGACRRVAILEHGRPVGIVTLDDLVLDRAVDVEEIRGVVEAQLTQPSRLKPEGATRPGEHAHDAREVLYGALLRDVEHHCVVTTPRAAEALDVALGVIAQGLDPRDAAFVSERLPVRAGVGAWRDADAPRREPAEVWEDLRAAAGLMPAASLDLLLDLATRIDAASSSSACRRALDHLVPRSTVAP